MSKIILSGSILIPDDALEAVLEELPNHIALTLQEPGCQVFSVEQDRADQNRLNVYEEFCDQAAFDSHQSRAQSSRWGCLTAGFSRNYSIKQSV